MPDNSKGREPCGIWQRRRGTISVIPRWDVSFFRRSLTRLRFISFKRQATGQTESLPPGNVSLTGKCSRMNRHCRIALPLAA